jgi:hypothetical protein
VHRHLVFGHNLCDQLLEPFVDWRDQRHLPATLRAPNKMVLQAESCPNGLL